VTLAAGTPLNTRGVTEEGEDVEVIEPLAVVLVPVLVEPEPLLPSKQPARVAVSTKPRINRRAIAKFPLQVPWPPNRGNAPLRDIRRLTMAHRQRFHRQPRYLQVGTWKTGGFASPPFSGFA